MQTLCVPYADIGRDAGLVERIRERAAEAIVFTRNDDMEGNPRIGPLLARTRMGYTCISAIDPEYGQQQTRTCVSDFLRQSGTVDLPGLPGVSHVDDSGSRKGTFTLVFDTEQLGGVRFGLPRILECIEPLGIRATFFVTGFVAAIYPDVFRRLKAAGHEIGIHGSMHEFLSGRSFEDQLRRVAGHAETMREFSEVRGANFIYRMDPLTVSALAQGGISYVVLLRKHRSYRSRYLRPSTLPRRLRARAADPDLTVFPISVETYQGDVDATLKSIRSAWNTAEQEGVRHVSILMHPFKDGSLKRMDATRRIVHMLVDDLGLGSRTLDRLPLPPDVPATGTRIRYRWHGWSGPDRPTEGISALSRSWWEPIEFHALRAESLADACNRADFAAILSVGEGEEARWVSVFPDGDPAASTVVTGDPLLSPGKSARLIKDTLGRNHSVDLLPPRPMRDAFNFALFHFPRTAAEWLLVLTKIGRRLSAVMGRSN